MVYKLITLILLLMSLSTSAQETVNRTVHYDYDANGNRIRRWVTVEEAPMPDTTGLLQHLDFVKADRAVELEGITEKARLCPNPTPGALELTIPWAAEQSIVEYGCYSLAGVELFRGKTSTVITKIDISRYPPGSYIVVLFGAARDVVWKVVRY